MQTVVRCFLSQGNKTLFLLLCCKTFCGKTALNAPPLGESSHMLSMHQTITTICIFIKELTKTGIFFLQLFQPPCRVSLDRSFIWISKAPYIFASKTTSCHIKLCLHFLCNFPCHALILTKYVIDAAMITFDRHTLLFDLLTDKRRKFKKMSISAEMLIHSQNLPLVKTKQKIILCSEIDVGKNCRLVWSFWWDRGWPGAKWPGSDKKEISSRLILLFCSVLKTTTTNCVFQLVTICLLVTVGWHKTVSAAIQVCTASIYSGRTNMVCSVRIVAREIPIWCWRQLWRWGGRGSFQRPTILSWHLCKEMFF